MLSRIVAFYCILSLQAEPTHEFDAFDHFMTELMDRYKLPGGALAIAYQRRVIFSRGYGLADRESLFRVASVSKPITAAAILKLVRERRLKLDSHPFDGAHVTDPRLRTITVEQLLHHTAGWDSSLSSDPMFRPVVRAPAMVMQSMVSQRLDFDPGQRFAYSNFGYCVLGRIIEKITGTTYENYVRTAILGPLGIRKMRIGKTLEAGRAPGEVKYYDYPNAPLVPSVFSGKKVPGPYGSFYLEAMDSSGGWIASAADLVNFASSVPAPQDVAPKDSSRPFYGSGWYIQGDRWWHAGSLPGTSSLLARNSAGYTWAALFNSRPTEDVKLNSELDAGLSRLISRISTAAFRH